MKNLAIAELLKKEFINVAVNRLHRLRPLIKFEQFFLKGYSLPPQQIDLYLTERCNLKCKICSVNETHGGQPNDKLSIEVIKNLIADVYRFRPLIYLTGGEPLLRKDIFDIIKIIREHHLLVGIVTNGYLLNEDVCSQLIASGIHLISVSIDGSEEIHDRIRTVPGSYSRAVDGLRTMVRLRAVSKNKLPFLRINSTTDGNSAEGFRHVLALGRELDVDMVKLHHLLFITPRVKEAVSRWAKSHEYDERMIGMFVTSTNFNAQDIKSFFKKLESRRAYPFDIRQFPGMSIDEIDNFYSEDMPSKKSSCLNNYLKALIFANGDVGMCYTKNIVFGNICRDSFLAIWNNDAFKRFRTVLNREKVIPHCFRCCNMQYRFK